MITCTDNCKDCIFWSFGEITCYFTFCNKITEEEEFLESLNDKKNSNI